MDRNELIDYHIKAAWHAIYRMYNQYAIQHNITSSMGFVLLNIDSREGTPATKIAPLMGMESRSLTRILKSMEEKKLIVRKKSDNDGRMVNIFLTALGKEKKEIAKNTVRTFNHMVREIIPESKFRIFLEVITEVENFIERGEFKKYLNSI
jgi:DNA-binding MarR family transcriptional regulator